MARIPSLGAPDCAVFGISLLTERISDVEAADTGRQRALRTRCRSRDRWAAGD